MSEKEVLEIIKYCEENPHFIDTQLHRLAVAYLELLTINKTYESNKVLFVQDDKHLK